MTDDTNALQDTQAEPEGYDRDALFERAKSRIDDYKEVYREQHSRIREDLRFSNPAKPEQWRDDDLNLRGKRPTLTLDRTNQFIAQVSNDMRQNNAGIEVIAADGSAHPKVAETLESVVRHIEYRSRAPVAYDTAADLQVRCGLGWLRVVPEDAEDGREIRIMRVTDPTAAGIDLDCLEPDGFGAKWGFVEGKMYRKTFDRLYPDAAEVPVSMEGWSDKDGEYVTIADYYEIDPKSGEVTWLQMTGAEIIEEPQPFPSSMIPLVPVVGYELWVDGKRYLCGLTRRLMDGQRLHNFEMSAIAEFLASQPKAPLMAPAQAMAGYEQHWARLASGNPAFLPYNAVDSKGNPIPAPQRVMPPPMPGAYAQMAQFATEEMQASVGMYKANLGQQGNETSGVAIRSRQMEGDVATFQFPDNLSKSTSQLGRIVVDMIPRVLDKAKVQRIVGLDGDTSFVTMDPKQKKPVRLDGKGKAISINPTIGTYDVRVKSGPSYTTMREQTVQQLSDMIQQQPALAPILGPMWARLRDMPEADKISKLLLAMAPPQVQQIESEGDDIPAHAAAQIQQLKQQLQQAGQAMQQATQQIAELRQEADGKRMEMLGKVAEINVDKFKAETDRIKVLGAGMTADQVQGLILQTLQQVFAAQPLDGGAPGQQPPPTDPMAMDMQPTPDQSLLPSGVGVNPPPGPPPLPDAGAMPVHPLAHQAPAESNEPPSGGSVVSGMPQ